MTDEEFRALVLKAFKVLPTGDYHYPFAPNQLRHFAALVAEAERKAEREPDAKKKPATMKQIITAHGTTIGAPWFEEFARTWKAAERFHGIRKEDGK
jgi:hypothetical protein